MTPRQLEVLGARIAGLGHDEQQIVDSIVRRIESGRVTYGEWHVGDGRDLPREALHELLDACAYIAGELVRLGRPLRRTKAATRKTTSPARKAARKP